MLLLFDIDGTLLTGATRAHVEAVHRALTDVYGLADPAAVHVEAAGRTDLEIARAIMLNSGVSAGRFDARIDEFRAACVAEYAQRCPESLADRVVPGIAPLLAELAARPNVVLSLVTGNLEPIARLKLARAGLGGWFRAGQGGFGSDSEDRTELPAIARRRAGRLLGSEGPLAGRPPYSRDGDAPSYPRDHTIVIGDTPRDIACARADDVRCVAVTTGPYGAEALSRADAVAASADELGGLLRRAVDGAGVG